MAPTRIDQQDGVLATYEAAFRADSRRLFPNIAVDYDATPRRRSVEDRAVGGFPIARVDAPMTKVMTSRRRAARHGLASNFKFFWQLSGTTRIEDADRVTQLAAGDLILLSLASTYELDMEEDACGLILMFDPNLLASWRDAANRHHGNVVRTSGTSAAASGALAALLVHARGDQSETVAVQSIIELGFAALAEGDGGDVAHGSMRLRRATMVVEQHLADPAFGPEQLARALGMSRRALYNRFAELGVKPADFIRQQRLQRARADIMQDQAGSERLDLIAIRNGFADDASLSHAFKAAYGMSPSQLRARRKPL
jgi:AraC-like DNA-binding protein